MPEHGLLSMAKEKLKDVMLPKKKPLDLSARSRRNYQNQMCITTNKYKLATKKFRLEVRCRFQTLQECEKVQTGREMHQYSPH